MKPAKHKFTILKQVMDIIPPYLVSKLSKKHGVDKRSRSFSPWSHVVSMVYNQLSHSLSLNDICDAFRNHSSVLPTIRGASGPSRNGLSHANRVRNADMAEDLFWEVLSNLNSQSPNFGSFSSNFKLPRRFKRIINLVDSTTIQLAANCMDWAKHRRRKAAAKCHMRLDAGSFLPSFAVVKSAKAHDSKEAVELCASIKSGEIVVFDKAYIDFSHLSILSERGVFWVSRAKSNMTYRCVKNRKPKKNTSVIEDKEIKLTTQKSKNSYPDKLRLVTANVEVDEKTIMMTFITNNFQWAPASICDLYKSRWGIEVFFKQLKQTLQLADFMGYSENAVRWQIWTALLTYTLLRFISYMNRWKGSFARLFTLIRGVLWNNISLREVLKFCGTAKHKIRTCSTSFQLCIPGIL